MVAEWCSVLCLWFLYDKLLMYSFFSPSLGFFFLLQVHFHLWYILSFVQYFALPFLFCTISFALLCTLLLLFDFSVKLLFTILSLSFFELLLYWSKWPCLSALHICMQPCSVFQAVMLVRICMIQANYCRSLSSLYSTLLYTPGHDRALWYSA